MAISAGTQEWKLPDQSPAGGSWQAAVTKRRVAISLFLFTSLIVVDMFVLHVLPRNILDWSNAGTVIGELLLSAGLAIRTWAAGTLQKSKSLIRQGPYALVRNPLYVGSFLMMFGFCTLIHDWHSIWFIVGPIAALYWLQVRHEETKLAQWFPDEWADYAATTPRFIPRRLSAAALEGWSLTLWVHNREYQALIWSLVSLAGLMVWRALAGSSGNL